MPSQNNPESDRLHTNEDYLDALKAEKIADLQGTHFGTSDTDTLRPVPRQQKSGVGRGAPPVTTNNQWRNYYEPVPSDSPEKYDRPSDEVVDFAMSAVNRLREVGGQNATGNDKVRVAIGARANRAYWSKPREES